MQYYSEISPFFEACFYLSRRFTGGRAGMLVDQIKKELPGIPNEYWECYDRIVRMEKALDSEFETDGLIREYFSPLRTKDVVNGSDTVSIGSILLRMPMSAPIPGSVDDLIEYYSKADTASIFSHFGEVLSAFDESTQGIKDLQGLVAAIDGYIVSPEDKWRIIDAVTDPAGHLKKLRGLINDISERIRESSGEFSELLAECHRLIGAANRAMLERLRIFDDMPEERISFMPSLFNINMYSRNIYETDKALIVLGVFVYRAFLPKDDTTSEDRFIYILKALSDATRLRVLHSLCDEYSYGQKLAAQYNSTPNALYYHLTRLLSCGLVEAHETEYRTLYTMNKYAVYDKLTSLRDYLLNGWLPEYARELKGTQQDKSEGEE